MLTNGKTTEINGLPQLLNGSRNMLNESLAIVDVQNEKSNILIIIGFKEIDYKHGSAFSYADYSTLAIMRSLSRTLSHV